ncbi:MAG: T9SS type A sorting domain-containing protein [Bacteroidetes bacterium]|nr:T9SS type A sorting domain-containing protein [Bacteroidota bacterium]
MKKFYGTIEFFLLIILATIFNSKNIFAQDISDLQKPRIAFFDCTAASVTGNSITAPTLQSFSHYIYQAIISDTTTQQVDLYTFGNIGNGNNDSSLAGSWTPSSDSAMFGVAFYIVGSISESSGSYTLTIYLKDAFTKTSIDSGTANFSSTDSVSIKTAASTAVSSLLPLVTIIRNYQKQIRASNSNLSIDPQLIILPSKTRTALNENISVTIKATDYDGYPLPHRKLKIKSSSGSVGSTQVETDGNGQANVSFTAGSTSGVSVISADMDNEVTVAKDTENVVGQNYVLTGDVNAVDSTQYYTKTLYELDFTLKVRLVGFTDFFSVDGANNTAWDQGTWADVYTAFGSVPGWGFYSSLANAFSFTADTGAVTGKMFKAKFYMQSASYPNDDCSDYHILEAETYNGIVDQTKLLKQTPGQLQYNPSNSPGNIYFFSFYVPFIYSGSSNTWGEPGGNSDGKGGCIRDNTPSDVYSGNQPDEQSAQFNDGQPGVSFLKSGDTYFINYTNVNVTEDTATSLTGYTYQAITTEYTATLRPIQSVTAVDNGKDKPLPRSFMLSQNYPNPFNPVTTIKYQIPAAAHVSLIVYDIIGNKIAALVDEEKPAGFYTVNFNAANLPSGVYFYRIIAGGFVQSKKLILMK